MPRLMLDLFAGRPLPRSTGETTMTAAEAVAAVRRGERVCGEFSLHAAAKDTPCPGFNCRWRVVFCDRSDEDVVECHLCGRQEVCRCDFDDEYA